MTGNSFGRHPPSSSWHGTDGKLAPFDSPAGGGGPGGFKMDGTLDSHEHDASGVPHPHAPASRFMLFAGAKAKKKPKPKPKPQPSTSAATPAHEMNVFGHFPSAWKGQPDAAIVAAAEASDWFPGTEDMKLFAKKGTHGGTETFDALDPLALLRRLGEIGRRNPRTVSRLNFFAHGADDGTIWVSGRVSKNNVDFVDEKFSISNQVMLDASSPDFVFNPLKKGPLTQAERDAALAEGITIEDARKAFTKDAAVVVYACHSALDKEYLARLGSLLGTRVQGFKRMTVWHLDWDEKHKITQRRFGLEGSTNFVDDFHRLPSDIDIPPPK